MSTSCEVFEVVLRYHQKNAARRSNCKLSGVEPPFFLSHFNLKEGGRHLGESKHTTKMDGGGGEGSDV